MTQDIGPEDDAAQGAQERVDEKQATDWRSRARASIALVILILILLLFLCQYFGGANRQPGTDSTPTANGTTAPPIAGQESTDTPREVSEGPVVPDVVGMTRSAAISTIEAAGYRASITDVYGTTRPANTVFEQHPSGGSRLDEGGTVGMLVQTQSKPTVTAPNLIGLRQSDAESRIRALGLRVTLSYAPPTGTRRVGRVYSQWPRAGEQVAADGDIQIQVTVKP